MLFEEMQKVAAIKKFQWLSPGEVKRRLSIAAGGHEDAFGCALVLHRAKQVTDGADPNSVLVAFGLDDNLAAEDGTGVEGHAVDAAIPGSPGLAGVQSHGCEQVGDEALEVIGAQVHQVLARVHPRHHVRGLDKARVHHVELDQWLDRHQLRWRA